MDVKNHNNEKKRRHSQTSVDKREKSTVDRRSLKAAASPQSGAMWRSTSGFSVGHVRDKIWLKHVKIKL